MDSCLSAKHRGKLSWLSPPVLEATEKYITHVRALRIYPMVCPRSVTVRGLELTLADRAGVRSRHEAQYELGLVVCGLSSAFVASPWALTLRRLDEAELMYAV